MKNTMNTETKIGFTTSKSFNKALKDLRSETNCGDDQLAGQMLLFMISEMGMNKQSILKLLDNAEKSHLYITERKWTFDESDIKVNKIHHMETTDKMIKSKFWMFLLRKSYLVRLVYIQIYRYEQFIKYRGVFLIPQTLVDKYGMDKIMKIAKKNMWKRKVVIDGQQISIDNFARLDWRGNPIEHKTKLT